ncbi:protein RESTRICTED TEV MOVEMENT 1 [Hevea brasiliensis]|nr:protein RESTRICTED TEV MOVEMENT 1 [Hevea brasiliensis]
MDSVTFWDEKGHGEISQIFVSHNEDYISCIQFQYVENGSLVLSPPYGAPHGPNFYSFQINCPSEFLVNVSGKYTNNGVRLITFTTNERKHGSYGNDGPPFGTQLREFNFDMGKRKQFGGFHGSFTTQGLKSIGVYVKPTTTTETSPAEISNSASDIRKTGN